MNIITVVGARPQLIKAAVLSQALAATGRINERLLHTGQHFDDNMSAVFFRELGLPTPCWNLGLGSSTHGQMTGQQLMGIEAILMQEKPDALLVYGDTNSTLSGALAAAKLHIPIAHVEAGLRSFNRAMPEEINRVLTDHMAHWLFAPTQTAMAHLKQEGLSHERLHLVGDVMLDAVLHFAQHAKKRLACPPILNAIGDRAFVLATVHRAENTHHPQRFANLVQALQEFSHQLPVVWPVHPRTQLLLQAQHIYSPHLYLIEPQGYLDMLELEQQAALIITDSGGVQKEAFFFGRPCVTVRQETEWIELVDSGWNRLAPPDSAEQLLHIFQQALGSQGKAIAPYGKGNAAHSIAQVLAAA
jgi:UDP-GlcNAc3NAcA epimerase